MDPGTTGGDICARVRGFFLDRLEASQRAGIARERLCFDPGVGFGKTLEENLALLAHVERTKVEGCAFLMAASRKRVTGAFCGNPPFEERLPATLAAHTASILGGADLVRVHDVKEAVQAARDIMLAEYLNLPVHIAHVSSALTVDIIAWGKARGVKVTAETCPHYLTLDESALDGYNTNAKVSPPLRRPEDREALRRAIKDGTIDILATDHAPHAAHEKERTLDEAPCGFTGMDLALTLTWQLVREGVISEADLHRLWSVRPAEIFNLPLNRFEPGDPADFFLFDPEEKWTVSRKTLYSKSYNTPFLGREMQGRVRHHWLGGVQLF